MKIRLDNSTPETEKFLREWFSDSDTITAHTSGSTGKPKEIRLLKSDMVVSATATCRYFSLTSDSVLVCPLSADYIAGKMMIVRALVSGAALSMINPSNRPDLERFDRITLLPVVPSQLQSLLENGSLAKKVTNLLVGGSPVSEEIEHRISIAGYNAFASYGMTETCSHVALRRFGDQFFEALPGIVFSTDIDSCLSISAPLFSFKSLQTNDIVNLADSTHFRWIGRRDNVIITGGMKVFPEDVERRIKIMCPSPFYLIGVPDIKWGERIVMYVESPGSIDLDRMTRELKKILPRHELPKEIRTVKSFKRTLSGKIKREEL